MYSQLIASTDIKGIEAKTPAIKVHLLANSEIATINATVTIILTTKYIAL